MDDAVYEVENKIEATHWWFVGRRVLLRKILDRIDRPKTSAVLDVGTGTGSNLRLLQELKYERVSGVDFSDQAIRFCAKKGLPPVTKGDICRLPFADDTFDIVLATDVIEHVDDDKAAVSELFRTLKPGGVAIITVPAFQSLWGLQDEVSHHRRRYRQGPLRMLIREMGFQERTSFYFNYFLFAPIWLARQIIRMSRIKLSSENQINGPVLNATLRSIFTLDVITAPILHPPFGVSLFMLAEKPKPPQ
ncbi:MAG: class I SAM-dependent methyltransferase [Planctomycetaceae bacterium]